MSGFFALVPVPQSSDWESSHMGEAVWEKGSESVPSYEYVVTLFWQMFDHAKTEQHLH